LNNFSYIKNYGLYKNYGFVAQELMNIIPEIVNYPTTSTPEYTIE